MSEIDFNKTITINRVDLISACVKAWGDIANEMKDPSIVLLGAILSAKLTSKLFDDKPEEVA